MYRYIFIEVPLFAPYIFTPLRREKSSRRNMRLSERHHPSTIVYESGDFRSQATMMERLTQTDMHLQIHVWGRH